MIEKNLLKEKMEKLDEIVSIYNVYGDMYRIKWNIKGTYFIYVKYDYEHQCECSSEIITKEILQSFCNNEDLFFTKEEADEEKRKRENDHINQVINDLFDF